MTHASFASAVLLGTTLTLSFFTGTSQGQTLVNLVTGATIAAGNAACPDQPYYLYAGGKQDGYATPNDNAYPSLNLGAYMQLSGPFIPYDAPMYTASFGDSFNLQNTRSVCYAIVQFKAKPTTVNDPWTALTFGHVGPGGAPFDIVAQVLDPGLTQSVQTYGLDATGLGLLSKQTGFQLDKTPEQSVLDVYLWRNTRLDFVRIYVWYGKNCEDTHSC
jgi:hypothetical protein